MEKIISAAKEQSRPIIPRKGKILFKLLNNIKYGSLSVIHPDGNRSDFKGSLAGPSVELIINNWAMASAMLGSGDIGLGESYRDGLWDCDHIDALIEFGILNQKEIERVTTGSALNIAFYRFKHWLNRNSKKGSQKNIHAH